MQFLSPFQKYLGIGLTTVLLLVLRTSLMSQGLEGVIVEEYYVSDANDAIAIFGAPGPVVGSTTYRIYVDMAPGFEIRSFTGYTSNPLTVSTTTGFYNNTVFGSAFGENLNSFGLTQGAVPLDSYFSFGLVNNLAGIPKADDTNGSIYGPTQLQGAVEPLNGVDGYLPATGQQGPVGTIGVLNLGAVTTNGGGSFSTSVAAFLNLNGSRGATADNKVLIGQFTTDGEFSFQLNIGIVNDLVQPQIVEFYTHTSVIDFDGNLSIVRPDLTYPPVVTGCTDALACNFNSGAVIDDGSCLLPVTNCSQCAGMGLIIIDSDGDGICDANEIPGCTSSSACNFNPNATDDNGTCIEPIANCQACNAQNTGLIIVDSDGDGICNAQEVPGCTSLQACNYNDLATDDNGSCLLPIINCQVCNPTNNGLVIVDTDGDGVCDANEIDGCTVANACNFNPNATDNDGTCIVPIANCQGCNATNTGLVLIDLDSDGVCNAQDPCPQLANLMNGDACTTMNGETGTVANCNCVFIVVPGCSSPSACNFDPEANQNDGSCIEPIENCQECNATNTGLNIIDTDGDGICDSEEIPGCTSPTACNFNSNATDEDNSCIEPILDCQACNSANTGLIIIDSDGDGICDAEEIPGCNNLEACNFDDTATDDDGSCIVPIEGCSTCNETNDGLILIDTDGDGVCDSDEILGCTSPTACDYNELATDDNGFCIEPEPNCFECNSTNTGLVIVDSDGDGVCDAFEVLGCTIFAACNYNSEATEESGDCIVPVADCSECNTNNTGLNIIDDDGDGICNAEEIAGCTNPDADNYNPDATDDDGSCIFMNVTDRYSLTTLIELYPNPTAGIAFLKLNKSLQGSNQVIIQITDALGQVVFNDLLSSVNSQLIYQVDVTNYADGIYLVNLNIDGKSGTVRFVKH